MINFQRFINENINEAKPAGLSKKETLKVAQKFAKALTKLDGMKYTVNSDYEEDSFDLDIEDQDDVDPRTTGEYAGGSYNINADGSVVNMAVWNKKNSSPVYGNMDDDINTIIKTIKNLKESVVTEAFSRMSNDAIGNELYAATQELTAYYDWLKAGNDSGKGKSIDHIISLLKKCKSSIKRFNDKEETIGTEYEAPAMESVVTEAKFVKDFNRDVLDAKTKEEVLELYPNAEFFIGKSDHFFGEFDENLFFKAYYTKGQKEFEIKSVYSEKGSNYVHLYNESVVNENYEVIFSDGMAQMKKFRNERQALDFMNNEIASNKRLRDIAVYKPGMHSTTQTELVVKFWGEGSYLDNVSKRDKDLAAKKLEESTVKESLNEAKKFYSTKEIAKISNAAGDIVVDAKYAIQDLGVAYGDKVPAKELDKVLTNYDLEIEDLTESIVTESKVTLKRRYTENHPAVTAGKFAKVRNKVLEAIADGTITQEEFDNILSELSNNAKRWSKNNSKYFTISEEGISLSKFGKRVLNSITVNEATTENPEIWVPSGFDKAITKLPNSQITRDVVLKVAKKHKVNPDDAIAYVEYGWMLDLNENTNKNMKTQFIYESFSEFANSLNESVDTELNEAFKSSKLRNLMNMDQASAYGKQKNLASAFYGMSKVKLDQVGDESLVDVDPKTAYKQYANNKDFVVFYIVDNEKENPYADREGKYSLKPGILALSRAKDFLSVSYDRRASRNSKNAKYTLDKDTGSAVGGNKNYKGYGATGISSIKRAAELADRAIVFNLVAGSPSSKEDISARIQAKEGAIAFKSAEDFKDANRKRYQEILAAKAAALPLDKMVEDAINQLTAQMQAGIKSGEKTQYGEIKVGQSSKGRDVKVTDVANHMNSILRDYERYVSYIAQAEKEKEEGYSSNYYERESKNYAKSVKDGVKKIKKFDYAW